MPRGDAVKDDSGAHVVFTEQGLSVSHMTAAKLMDAFARLPGYAGQAADAVEDAPRLPNKMGELPDVCSQMSKNACTWLDFLDLTQACSRSHQMDMSL